jgi:hypothetical protein
MPDGHYEDDQLVVASLAQDAIVPDAIAPKAPFVPNEGLAATAGVDKSRFRNNGSRAS